MKSQVFLAPLFLAFVLLLPVSATNAAVPDLYVGSAPVADQSPGERNRAMPEALAQVLGKLSGLGTFDDRPEVALALEQARDIAVSFHYSKLPVLLPDGTASDELQLVVNFSRKAVDELVHALQLPLWKPERRVLTVWLVVDDDLGRRIMPIELEYVWSRMVRAAADRGLPVRRPEPDADGLYAVDIQLLWGGYTEELSAEEGPADALVIAALREGPEWNLRLNLDYGGERWSWRERGIDLQQLLTGVVNRTVDEVARSSAIAATDLGRQSHELTVTGITEPAQYVRCLAYLQGLSLIDGVRVVSVSPGTVQLGLELNALPEYLDRSLAQDGVLVTTESPNVYRLVDLIEEHDEAMEVE